MAKEWWIVSLSIVILVGVKNSQASDGTTSCTQPKITPLNFHLFVSIENGTNRTLSCEIHSDTPLKLDPVWRRHDPSYLPAKYSINSSSCSLTTNKTCVLSNLTLIDVVRGHYEGNYSVMAENDCGNETVYVYVNVMVLKSCITDKPPKLLVAPPSTVWAVQGENVTIKALYKGDFDDISEGNLLAYWRITTLDSNTRYIYPTNNYTSYYVTTDRCLPTDCCYFTVSIEIKSLTLDLSQANVSSAVVWLDDLNSFNPGNSTLVVYVYPTLVEQLPPNANNTCIELYEGHSTEFGCKYTASTDPNVTITTWKFNEVPLQHNSSHYTIITDYGTDPINANSVLSRLKLSNAVAENAGTYTCQCGYNSVVYNKGIVSNTAHFCFKVNATSSPSTDTGKKWQSYIQYALIAGIPTVVMVVMVILLIVFIYFKKRKSKKLEMKSTQDSDEIRPLLSKDPPVRQLLNLAAGNHKPTVVNAQIIIHSDHSINNQDRKMSPPENTKEKSLTIIPNGDVKPTDQTKHQELISGQDTSASIVAMIPSHSKTNRQHGDLVTGSTATSTTTNVPVHESDRIHDHPSVPEQVDHSTSVESFSKSPNRNEYTNQSTTLESYTPDNRNKSADVKDAKGTKPSLVHCPTDHATECEPEGPRPSGPAITVPMPSDVSNANEGIGRVLNSIAPDLKTLVNLETLLPYLQRHQLLTDDEESYLSNMLYSSSTRAQMLSRYLKHKGDGSLQMFLCSLNLEHEHKGHKALAEKLKRHMQTAGIYCTDFCSDDCK